MTSCYLLKALPQTGPVNSETSLWSLSSGSITGEAIEMTGMGKFQNDADIGTYTHMHRTFAYKCPIYTQ